MNRFKIVLGKEKEFENIWLNRESRLDKVPGFVKFNLVRGESNDDHTLYASHSTWASEILHGKMHQEAVMEGQIDSWANSCRFPLYALQVSL